MWSDSLRRVAGWLRRIAALMDPPPPGGIAARATELVRQAELFAEGTSGEYKRHWVYARLQKAFPSARGRVLSLAIERAVQELP